MNVTAFVKAPVDVRQIKFERRVAGVGRQQTALFHEPLDRLVDRLHE